MSYKLFLDDYRTPNDAYYYTNNNIYLKNDWVVVKNYNNFINYITEHSIPDIISFDHDLGLEHYGNHVEGDVIDYKQYNEKTGYDCAKWLIDYIIDNNLNPPKMIYIHSMNPVGGNNIKELFINFNKHYYK